MVDFLLIHGGSHGSWCWEKVVPYLSASTEVDKVVAVDLLADAQTVTGKVKQEITNADYVAGVVDTIERLNMRNIIIVGHSFAGITIPAVVHRVPDRIHHVSYLTTSHPSVGQSMVELMQHPLSPISRGVSRDDMFCSGLDDETANWLKSNLQEDPPLPYVEKVDFCILPDGVSATYIVCLQDMALPVCYQMEQAKKAGVSKIVELNTGHSAFASMPEELSMLLLEDI